MTEPRALYSSAEFAVAYPNECTTVEFKTGSGSKPLQEAFVALSNTDGGVVFVGVDNAGRVVGRRLDQGTEEDITRAAQAVHDVGRYKVREVSVDNSRIVAVIVQPRQGGFSQTSEGRTLVRRGPANVALFGQDLQDFINSKALKRFERSESELTMSDVDDDLLVELRGAMRWDDKADLEDRLAERGLLQASHLSVAGSLFLTRPGTSLRLAKAVVEVRRFPDEGTDYDRREVFDGALHHQVRDAARFVSDELGSDLIVTGLFRHELSKLPQVVIREAIANAVAHRTYEVDRTSVLVEIRPSAVIVRSPGSLPEPVTIETIRTAQAARNPIIIDVLRKFSLAEDAGRGVDVIQDQMADALLDPPTFADDGAFVTVVLPLSGPITGRERAWIAELERQGSLDVPDRLLLVHAARGETLTNKAARSILATEDSGQARRALQRLRDAGILKQTGDRASAQYRLTDGIAPPAAYRMSRIEIGEMVVQAASVNRLTNEIVRELTGLGRREALQLLSHLVKQGRLVRHGSKRGSYYTI